MPSLKDLRDRKRSVESTRKITSAMKMVAAAKLRRAQEQALAARPYALQMGELLTRLVKEATSLEDAPLLMKGTGHDQTYLFVILTSDRGLCGGFNSNIVREARARIKEVKAKGKRVKILCVGRKGRDQLRREFDADIYEVLTDLGKPRPSFQDAEMLKAKLLHLFEEGQFDKCVLISTQFKSAMTQLVTSQTLIPFEGRDEPIKEAGGLFEYEPDEASLLNELLPRNLSVQLYRALLETFASEQGARMTAMDSATRNAGDMIKRLDLTYNRARQAYITKELIEIISGAEAL